MTRRFLLLILTLALFLTPISALASGCNAHADAGVTAYYGVYYDSLGASGHLCYRWAESYCNTCGDYVGVEGDAYHETQSPHTMVGDVCKWCGYNQVTNTVTGTQSGSAALGMRHMRDTALAMGAAAAGRRAILLATAPLRIDSDPTAFFFVTAQRGELCSVRDMLRKDDAMWYQLVTDQGYIGWVNAAIVRVQGEDGMDELTLSSDTLERQTVVKVTVSGNVREGASVDHPIVAKVQQGEIYPVLDQSTADAGRLWYQIQLPSGTGWVSSGIVQLIE